MNNKDAAVTFFKMVCDHQVKEAYDKFIAPNFKHHNSWWSRCGTWASR